MMVLLQFSSTARQQRANAAGSDECDNFADPQTKYLTTKVWLRHLHYTHNISGEPPPVAVKNKKKVVSIEESDKE